MGTVSQKPLDEKRVGKVLYNYAATVPTPTLATSSFSNTPAFPDSQAHLPLPPNPNWNLKDGTEEGSYEIKEDEPEESGHLGPEG